MLEVFRKVGQGIVIGDDIQVFVLRRSGGEVRLGIQAPREMNIGRDTNRPGSKKGRANDRRPR